MASRLEFGCLPTAIGSMPQEDPDEACRQVASHLSQVPAWPQLPNRSPLENMYLQFSEGFPATVIEGQRLVVESSPRLDSLLESLYDSYLKQDLERYGVSPEYAAGLYAFIAWDRLKPLAAKGQITGPVTWALGVTDREQRPILYDDVLADAAAKFLHLKATWQERALKRVSPRTMVFVDEPSMSYLGSGFVSLPGEKVTKLLDEVLSGVSDIKGIHCCGNTDWSVVLKARTDIVSFDAYEHSQHFSLYPAEVGGFLARGVWWPGE
jgi:hypothetical protein